MAYFSNTSALVITPRTSLPPDSVIFGRSSAMRSVRHDIEKVKNSNVTVLIQGESGTGKEIVATVLHSRSTWAEGSLVKVNCPAIPGSLMESELFGYERGAFTGAYGSKPGRVEMAHRGTLLLDEIGELDTVLQAKLLQLLQDGHFSRIGSQGDKRVDLRVICATNRNLDQEMQGGTFRRDLFYRINGFTVKLPALRDRREDIPELVSYFLETQSEALKCKFSPLSHGLMELIENYDWPGNIRQLENLMKRYVILGREECISEDLLGDRTGSLEAEILAQGPLVSLKKLTRQAAMDCERKVILGALNAHRWNRKEAARALRIGYRTMLHKMRQAGLPSRNGHSHPVVPVPIQLVTVAAANGFEALALSFPNRT